MKAVCCVSGNRQGILATIARNVSKLYLYFARLMFFFKQIQSKVSTHMTQISAVTDDYM